MCRDERKILALTLTDGGQAVVLLTLLPFILLRVVSIEPAEGIAGVGPLSAGFLLGIVGTIAIGRMADKWSPYTVLQILQFFQVLLSIGLVLCFLRNLEVVSTFLVALCIGLLRSSGPAKDKIRSIHIPRGRRTSFNALVRRWFLVVNQALIVALTVVISFLPPFLWPILLLVSTLLVCCSALLTRSLSARGGVRSSDQENVYTHLSGTQARELSLLFLVIIILSLGVAIPTIGLTAWISLHRIPPWVLSVFGLYIVVYDFWFIKLLGAKLSNQPQLWGIAIKLGAGSLILGVVASWAIGPLEAGWLASILLIVLGPAVATSSSIATMFAMEVQHGFATDSLRGRISSYTRISSAVGTAVASIVAPAIFLNEVGIIAGVLLSVACVLIISGPAVRRLLPQS